MMNQRIDEHDSTKDDWEQFQFESDGVRDIILMYKTKACCGCEDKENCFGFHDQFDRRRNPFSFRGKISYIPVPCKNNNCNQQLCKFSHNSYEVDFHPWSYRTLLCDRAKTKSNRLAGLTSNSILKCLGSFRSSNSSGSFLNPNTSFNTENLRVESNRSSLINTKHHKSYLDSSGSYIPSSQRNSKQHFSLVSISESTGYLTQLPSEKYSILSTFTGSTHTEKYCPFYHNDNEKRKLRESEFSISLDLSSLIKFKVEKCELKSKHSDKQCFFFHTSKDKRRNQLSTYFTSEMCTNADKHCIFGDLCTKCHNQVEVLYHIDKFKTRFCCHYDESKSLSKINEECPYGSICSFVHCETEIRVELIHKLPRNESFYLNSFKTVLCPYDKHHDKAVCVYAHNYQDYRRSPLNFIYDKKYCLNWNNRKIVMNYFEGCENSFSCPFSHGWKEQDYHPMTYKTIKCKHFKDSCDKGDNCPFYHSNEPKR